MSQSPPRRPSAEFSPLEMSTSNLYLRRKPTQPQNRVAKRSGGSSPTHASSSCAEAHPPHASGAGRSKRVWKACERCRMKKTKCDGQFPCRRCKEDGSICTATIRKRGSEYKRPPQGYAEVLETTQLVLVATIRKLYQMLRDKQQWALGPAAVNNHGEPIVHDIAKMLDCIRVQSEIDLPIQCVFPEDMAEMQNLTRQLEKQQSKASANETESYTGYGSDSEHPVPSLADDITIDDSWSKDLNMSEAKCEQPLPANGGLSLGLLEMDIYSKATSMLAREKELRQLRDKFPLSPLNGYPFWSYSAEPNVEDAAPVSLGESYSQSVDNGQESNTEGHMDSEWSSEKSFPVFEYDSDKTVSFDKPGAGIDVGQGSIQLFFQGALRQSHFESSVYVSPSTQNEKQTISFFPGVFPGGEDNAQNQSLSHSAQFFEAAPSDLLSSADVDIF